MNAIDLSTQARPQHYAQSSNQDDYQRAFTDSDARQPEHLAIRVTIARCIATAVILTTIGLTEWYGSVVYGNPLVSSQEELPGRDGAPSVEYFPAQYVNQATELDQHVEAF